MIQNFKSLKKCAFSYSSIYNITITSKLVELKEGWCCDVLTITNMNISPENSHYCC